MCDSGIDNDLGMWRTFWNPVFDRMGKVNEIKCTHQLCQFGYLVRQLEPPLSPGNGKKTVVDLFERCNTTMANPDYIVNYLRTTGKNSNIFGQNHKKGPIIVYLRKKHKLRQNIQKLFDKKIGYLYSQIY